MNTTNKLTNRALAKVYDTNERQISRWRAENAPLRDIGRMLLFWVTRKSYPKHLHDLSAGRQAEMQEQLDAFDDPRPGAVTWLDYARASSEALCDIDADFATLRNHPRAPVVVRAKAEELTRLLHSFIDAFHDGFEAAGIDTDAEIIDIPSVWKRKQAEADE